MKTIIRQSSKRAGSDSYEHGVAIATENGKFYAASGVGYLHWEAAKSATKTSGKWVLITSEQKKLLEALMNRGYIEYLPDFIR